ncbi:PilZ domain-containing protein [Oceanicoccus sp. KOV_DT_Chl]|uniref:PilZ domain-containing protein n=1 Tax=Oceanicoccus sp. KOV_DT_Chl TaxID=1904639 RepID=UPI000C7AE950|nr:PilZ domain-containing protein [Oceanicoccus sp. KOV_DT_Chl]
MQLLGFNEGKNLLVTVLSKPGQVLLQAGQAVSLEAPMAKGSVQFETAIEHIHESPFLYLVLDYPLGVNFSRLRQHERIPVDTPVELTGHTALGMNTSSINGFMLDVSVTGAKIVLEKEITSMVTTMTVGVMLSAQGLERDMELTAELRNKTEPSEAYPECGFAYGIEFINQDEINALFLHAFCLQEVIRGRALLVKA